MYFKGDPYLGPRDACGGGCHSDDGHRIIEFARSQESGRVWSRGTFDIILKPSKA